MVDDYYLVVPTRSVRDGRFRRRPDGEFRPASDRDIKHISGLPAEKVRHPGWSVDTLATTRMWSDGSRADERRLVLSVRVDHPHEVPDLLADLVAGPNARTLLAETLIGDATIVNGAPGADYRLRGTQVTHYPALGGISAAWHAFYDRDAGVYAIDTTRTMNDLAQVGHAIHARGVTWDDVVKEYERSVAVAVAASAAPSIPASSSPAASEINHDDAPLLAGGSLDDVFFGESGFGPADVTANTPDENADLDAGLGI